MSYQYALITGAGVGLGRCYALELSKRNINTILVGLTFSELEKLASQIKQQFGTQSVAYQCDLSVKENIVKMAGWVDENFNVSILINNAGIGGTKRFVEADVNYVDKIIQLNVMGTALVTHQLLPNLLKQPEAYILNVSSIAAYSPMGFKTVYPASKAFIDHFSRGLRQELANTNVFVGEIHPGPISTSQERMDRMNKQGFLARKAVMTPEDVAAVSIKKMFAKKTTITLNFINKLNLFLMKLLSKKYITNKVRQELEE